MKLTKLHTGKYEFTIIDDVYIGNKMVKDQEVSGIIENYEWDAAPCEKWQVRFYTGETYPLAKGTTIIGYEKRLSMCEFSAPTLKECKEFLS